ncbi:hypothetical protein GQ55_2G484500 [Panicum hallii var. hallii]|uniref:Uncharacterized protein n=1 Tax=Panicum hallii var. hallii TaxID=1504633 RepID=A0A2T7F0F5_9POAL|nr:hypothetical protein GQ55_2G484500 [Panicum hallii var. hallii]
MQRTESMLIDHRSLHINPASALPENSCSEDTKVDTPPLLAIPPMQWLSVKVHTGPITYRKPSGKYPVQRAEGRIMKITELSGLAAHSYEAWSEPAGTNSRQEQRHTRNNKKQGSNLLVQILTWTCKSLTGQHKSKQKITRFSIAREQRFHLVAARRCQTGTPTSIAMQTRPKQLARMAPPWVPRPKHPLPEVECHDGLRLRNAAQVRSMVQEVFWTAGLHC